ncbi:hypothetical protein O6P43_022040 [Quillaja saponaria]|uniref:Uncharacterized protein n=1 Tax=Quillaja saponaria TaxID=32244 RepID=A0AAD7LCD3_QUISA|nr:hypothetical protein O6P43_022040 [Quillaja saponaria]
MMESEATVSSFPVNAILKSSSSSSSTLSSTVEEEGGNISSFKLQDNYKLTFTPTTATADDVHHNGSVIGEFCLDGLQLREALIWLLLCQCSLL